MNWEVNVILTSNDRRVFNLEAGLCVRYVRFKNDIQGVAGGMCDSRQCISAECAKRRRRFVRTVVHGHVVKRTFLF